MPASHGEAGSSLAGDSLRRIAADTQGDAQRMLIVAASALDAVDAGEAVRRHTDLRGGVLRVGDRFFNTDSVSSIVVLGIGKASTAMARGLAEEVGDLPLAGAVVSAHEEPVPEPLELYVGGHPLPNAASLIAGRRLMELAAAASRDDLVICLLSGGASALAELPVPGITLEDLRITAELLLRSGAPIEAINSVRVKLSLLKGGGLGARAVDSPLVTLAISDVGDKPNHVIGSGPTLPPGRGTWRAAEVLEQYGLSGEVPEAVRQCVSREAVTLHAVPQDHDFQVVADASRAVGAAGDEAARQGLVVMDSRADLEGEARVAAVDFIRSSRGEGLTLWAGETTVTVTGQGLGGRNQEAALAAAAELDGVEGATFLALGTDGIDGPSDAAGAVVDSHTVERLSELGFDPGSSLASNDAYPALDAVGSLIRCGPTGTNVGDLWLLLRRDG